MARDANFLRTFATEFDSEMPMGLSEQLLFMGISKYFHVRCIRDEQQWLLLQNNEQFIGELEKIREHFRVPPLDAATDMSSKLRPFGDSEIILIKSTWLSGLSAGECSAIKRGIKKRLSQFGIRYNFYDLVLRWLLYRAIPEGNPPYYWGLFEDASNDPSILMHSPLIEDEIKYCRWALRTFLGVGQKKSGRRPREITTVCKAVEANLRRYKNTSRRMRALKSTLKVAAELKTRTVLDGRNGSGENNKFSPKTWMDIAAIVEPDVEDDSVIAEKKRAAKLRKQYSRLHKHQMNKH